MYPPTVPPIRVRIAGIVAGIPEEGTKVLAMASPTGGLVMNMTMRMTTIIRAPRYFTTWSIRDFADFDRKITMARRAVIT